MQEEKNTEFGQQVFQEEEEVDLKKIISALTDKWYLFIICIAITLSGAYLFNRHATPEYAVSATVMIDKEDEGGRVLRELGDFRTPTVNLENEKAFFKSLTVAMEATHKLPWKYSVQKVKLFNDKTLFGNLPFKVVIDTSYHQAVHYPISIDVLSANEYRLQIDAGKGGEETKLYDYANLENAGSANFADVDENMEFGEWFENENFRFKLLYNSDYFDNDNNKGDSDFNLVLNGFDRYARELNRMYSVEEFQRDSEVLRLSGEFRSPEMGIEIINTIIETQQDINLNFKNLRAERTEEFIEKELGAITDSLSQAEAQLRSLQEDYQMLEVEDRAQPLFARFHQLEQKKAEEELKLNYFESVRDYIQKSQEDKRAIIAPSTVGIESNLLLNLVEELNTLYSRRRSLLITSTFDDPRVRALDSEIAQVEEKLLENMANTVDQAKMTIEDVDTRIEELQENLTHLPLQQLEMTSIQRRYNVLEELYTFLLEKRSETGIQKAGNVADYRMVDPARFAEQVFPKNRQNYAIALVLGLILPAGAIYLGRYIDTKIRSAEEIEQAINIPILGSITKTRYTKVDDIFNRPRSVLAESLRSLRAKFKFYSPEASSKVITVTSSLGNEGKSFVSEMIAGIIAFSEKKCLLINADLRKPAGMRLEDFLNLKEDIKSKHGLSNYLVGQCSKEEIILETPHVNIDIIASGPLPPNSGELFEKEKFSLLLKDLQQDYDFIIIDTSPVGLVVDSFYIMEHSHINLFVIRQDYTPKVALENLKRLLTQNKINNMGIILNDVDFKRSKGYSYGGYGYYAYNSNYYQDDEENSMSGIQRFFNTLRKSISKN